MNIIKYYWMGIIIVNVFIYWKYSSSFIIKQRSSYTLIKSSIVINSFNPSRLDFVPNSDMIQSSSISIIDNSVTLIQLSKLLETSTITLILSDGFHHLDIVILDEIQTIKFYQSIDIATGSQSLIVTILDQQYKPVENISVHLELFDYPHITHEYYTNQLGEVIFHYLSRHIRVYIEAICMNSKRHAFVEIDTLHYRNITLILKEIRS